MLRPALLFIVGSTLFAATTDVRALADRIEKLAVREPLESAIDTRLRAGLLLQTVDRELAGKFLGVALEELRNHPEVPRYRTITASIVALERTDADSLLVAGTDRL